jgi:enamidase
VADLAVMNIGAIVSGDMDRPLLEGDTVVVRDGKIAQVGPRDAVDMHGIDRVIDAAGAVVCPGLIDSHVHPVVGDFTPRQNTLNWIDSYLHGGVTAMVSAGEVHTPGRPKDAVGTKALAILAHKAFASLRPAGVKVLAGSVLLEPGLTESDFAEMAGAGVRTVGEIGISGVYRPEDAEPMTRWAQQYGLKVMIHTGGTSVPGSSTIDADTVFAIRPDVVSHINGGPTAMAIDDIERIVSDGSFAFEVVQAGNVRALAETARLATKYGALGRMLIGTDTPSGTGVIPLGVLRTISHVSALGQVAPELALCMATGNTARLYGFNFGIIRPGADADLVIMDAPRGSQAKDALQALAIGDTPAVAAVIVDGQVKVYRSRNTPPPTRDVKVPWMSAGGH